MVHSLLSFQRNSLHSCIKYSIRNTFFFKQLNIREEEPETVTLRILEMLGNVKYRPPAGIEPTLFRSQLLAGDSRTIHHALHWILSNKEQVKNTAYLAKYVYLLLKFLIPITNFTVFYWKKSKQVLHLWALYFYYNIRKT